MADAQPRPPVSAHGSYASRPILCLPRAPQRVRAERTAIRKGYRVWYCSCQSLLETLDISGGWRHVIVLKAGSGWLAIPLWGWRAGGLVGWLQEGKQSRSLDLRWRLWSSASVSQRAGLWLVPCGLVGLCGPRRPGLGWTRRELGGSSNCKAVRAQRLKLTAFG